MILFTFFQWFRYDVNCEETLEIAGLVQGLKRDLNYQEKMHFKDFKA